MAVKACRDRHAPGTGEAAHRQKKNSLTRISTAPIQRFLKASRFDSEVGCVPAVVACCTELTGGRPWRVFDLLGFRALGSARTGVAFVSDRLDIVRVIDARVTASRRTVVRSKQLADAAKDDLKTHEEWLEHHREQAREDLERHQRRLKRRHRLQNCKRFAISAALFLPRLCVAAYRGVASSLRALDRAFFAGCAWIVGRVWALACWLIRLLGSSIGWISAKLLTLGLWMTAGLWLGLSLLGEGARDTGVSAFGAGSHGLSWLRPRAQSFGHSVARLLSLCASRFAALSQDLGVEIGRGIERQITTLPRRWSGEGGLPKVKREDKLDLRHLQQATFVRLRAEHDQLQARIHALDRCYAQRAASTSGRRHGAEWAEVRRLALNARRLLEVQESHVLGQAASREDQTHSSKPNRANDAAHIDPLWAGHAIYEAPALRRHLKS